MVHMSAVEEATEAPPSLPPPPDEEVLLIQSIIRVYLGWTQRNRRRRHRAQEPFIPEQYDPSKIPVIIRLRPLFPNRS
jgi:hypothetical protein